MRLIHVPNATQWRVGDFVIHDSDAKRADMLMVVIGCSHEGIYRTRYAFPEPTWLPTGRGLEEI